MNDSKKLRKSVHDSNCTNIVVSQRLKKALFAVCLSFQEIYFPPKVSTSTMSSLMFLFGTQYLSFVSELFSAWKNLHNQALTVQQNPYLFFEQLLLAFLPF